MVQTSRTKPDGNRPDHVCSGRMCLFCRVLSTSERGKSQPGVNPDQAAYVVERTRELGKRSLIAGTEAQVASQSDELEKAALFDSLTDFYNSRTFTKAVKTELKRARRYKRPLAICVLSIDGFDDIQSKYGALTADAVLKSIAAIIRATIRDVDMPARYSASDLAVIFPETDAQAASIAVDRIRQKIAYQPISTHNWESLKVTASFGVAVFPNQGNTADEMVGKALTGLLVAKQRGGDQSCAV